MNIIEDPSKADLDRIQQILDEERNIGICDIWAKAGGVYILLKKGTQVVGVAALNTAFNLELYKLYIVPDYRGQGHAKKLLNYIIGQLKSNNEILFVESLLSSLSFWQKVTLGFSITWYSETKFAIHMNE